MSRLVYPKNKRPDYLAHVPNAALILPAIPPVRQLPLSKEYRDGSANSCHDRFI